MSELYDRADNMFGELVIPESFSEALSYAEQLIWLYLHKQNELIEGENITITDNGDGTVTISASMDGVKGIDRIESTVETDKTVVVIYYTDGTNQSFNVLAGPQGPQGIQGIPGQDGAPGAKGDPGLGIKSIVVTNVETVSVEVKVTQINPGGSTVTQGSQKQMPKRSVLTITYDDDTTDTVYAYAGVSTYVGETILNLNVTPNTHTIKFKMYNPADGMVSSLQDVTIADGAQGPQGVPGQDGTNGQDGAPGTDGRNGTQIWNTTDDYTTPNYTFNISDLSGVSGTTPAVDDIIMQNVNHRTFLFIINTVDTTTVLCDYFCEITGATGATGPAGQGVPAGGTEGQVLTKVDGTDFNTQWRTPSGGNWGAIILEHIIGDSPYGQLTFNVSSMTCTANWRWAYYVNILTNNSYIHSEGNFVRLAMVASSSSDYLQVANDIVSPIDSTGDGTLLCSYVESRTVNRCGNITIGIPESQYGDHYSARFRETRTLRLKDSSTGDWLNVGVTILVQSRAINTSATSVYVRFQLCLRAGTIPAGSYSAVYLT